MGIFTRLSDIISSNLNAMLDKAEDPEKLIRLMIQEMEDTLVEIKASCAGVMATKKSAQRELEETRTRAQQWGEKAQLAVNKGREDLAREALLEKRRYRERATVLEKELSQCDALVEQYQADMSQLEDKLGAAREKQRILVQRHIHAQRRKRAQQEIRRLDTADALIRFEQFENRIERMEAEADLVNFGRKPPLEEEFARLEGDEEIEKELQTLKTAAAKKIDDSPSA
ncbi:MAG TPA: phage shock protein PspA [Candidatus Binatia bacterium]|jgi:phage shock protein A|nr:phage shock protein PspA [Candidatus Binatia bacterium]